MQFVGLDLVTTVLVLSVKRLGLVLFLTKCGTSFIWRINKSKEVVWILTGGHALFFPIYKQSDD
jgi:hypothetical protein